MVEVVDVVALVLGMVVEEGTGSVGVVVAGAEVDVVDAAGTVVVAPVVVVGALGSPRAGEGSLAAGDPDPRLAAQASTLR